MTAEDPKSNLLRAIETFETEVERSVKISESRLGIDHTGRQNRVLMTFAKAIVHSMSIQLIYSKSVDQTPEFGLLDHSSIGVLTRTQIDASIMTLYLSEPNLSADEWNLRRHVLFLHDATNRRRFLKSLYKLRNERPLKREEKQYRTSKANILQAINQYGEKVGLNEDEIEKLSKGQTVFINGVRGAVREAGLDVTEFEFINTYLSNQVHSHPVSTMRSEKLSFDTPTEYQMNFCGLCLSTASRFLKATSDRVEAFTGDMKRDPNGHI